MRWLCLPAEQDVIDYADDLLKLFVKCFVMNYGKRHASANVHGLLHISSDVRLLGPLDTFSAFRYENFLRFLKQLANLATEKPLESFTKRYCAIIQKGITINTFKSPVKVGPALKISGGPVTNNTYVYQYSKYHFKRFFLTINVPDNCCRIGNDYVVVENFVENREGDVSVIGRKYLELEDFYDTPCSSSILNIYAVRRLSNLTSWKVTNVTSKWMLLPIHNIKDSFVAVPLLHTSLEDDQYNEDD